MGGAPNGGARTYFWKVIKARQLCSDFCDRTIGN
jgi:hypothetical protein